MESFRQATLRERFIIRPVGIVNRKIGNVGVLERNQSDDERRKSQGNYFCG